MSLVVLGSVKASPGVTTTALALGAVWPAPHVLVVEADPAGGVLSARLGLPPEPGLTTLAAACRRNPAPDGTPAKIWDHAQTLPGGLPVLVGAPSPDQARAVLAHSNVVDALRTLDADVFVDAGRLDARSPALALARAADLVVLLARPRVDEVQLVVQAIDALSEQGCEVALALLGNRPYSAREVQSVVTSPLLGVLADDARTAATLGSGHGNAHALLRSLLVRTARDLAGAIRTHIRPAPSPTREPATEVPA